MSAYQGVKNVSFLENFAYVTKRMIPVMYLITTLNVMEIHKFIYQQELTYILRNLIQTRKPYQIN